ncbi:Osmosensitive K channel signal transduction histidine kinase, sensor subunit KdpD [Flavobacterium beibuense]|uniref:Osmosensitive K channel signal transduction histidine kinase, sensor subunit KdpD n=1 Tax=Flavobacterium beibuense TaxID=657326 RepID=A0A444WGW4_9FLAO|nr:Osmosensitive K channel signal transduction histidine kinase, sensor subunit KdpD [Flavobacterium beibuense]
MPDDIKEITGIEVKERIPYSVLKAADEMVNIDLIADELITRLKEGKIYTADKIQSALGNFFKPQHIGIHTKKWTQNNGVNQVTNRKTKETIFYKNLR